MPDAPREERAATPWTSVGGHAIQRGAGVETSWRGGGLQPALEYGLQTSSKLSDLAPLIVVIYLVAGVVFYSWAEGWDYDDALFFSVTTLTTVGYGDLVPTDAGSRVFTCVYVLVGVTLVASCLGVVIAKLQKHLKQEYAGSSTAGLSRGGWMGKWTRLGELARLLGTLCLLLSLGTGYAMWMEGLGLVDAIYFSIVTCATVGYGDVLPESSHAFACFYMLIGVAVFALCAGRVTTIFIQMEQDAQIDQFMAQGVNEQMIREIDIDKSGSIDRHEFMRYMLEKMGEVMGPCHSGVVNTCVMGAATAF
jgi:potassium channel subfamily K